ncbi:MAG: LodA/GoxA family CTQ-dependent oxidase [Acidimicrobiia bacterium]
MRAPTIYTRREFLRSAAAAGAVLAAGPTLVGVAASSAGATGRHDDIASIAIHPAVGIARVGNSADSFHFGPEVPGTIARSKGGYKDASGAIARQAARFRIFGLDAKGRVVRELTEADGTIEWTVSVANKKAQWYDFDVALDLPIAQPVGRRNASTTGADRDALVIAPGPKSIGGRTRGSVALDGGTFLGEDVPLGELMVDGSGRLVFLPATGVGYSPTSAPLTTFSDNDGWADDICDGPVLATVKIGNRTLKADPAWVVVTPPNYGPALVSGLVTAYDSARTAWDLPRPRRIGFGADILPLLSRLVDMQWVNAGFLESNGWGTPGDFLDPKTLDRLANPRRSGAAARTSLFDQFRDPSYTAAEPEAVPQIYGDGVAIPATSAYQWLTVTPIQYDALRRWADGDFVDDRDDRSTPEALADVPLADRPAALDRAALEACLGGAYHPGIEVPWTLRVPMMWAAPGRLKMRSETASADDYGSMLTPEVAMSAGGPVDGSGPGDLTRWQGTPWQSDAGSCRSGYEPAVSPVLPTFWPARIPNHVLREADYETAIDTSRPMEERTAAFHARYDWERFVSAPNRVNTLANMMAGWWKLGFVEARPGPDDDAFPKVMKVESNVGFDAEPPVTYGPGYTPEPEPVTTEPVSSPPPP